MSKSNYYQYLPFGASFLKSGIDYGYNYFTQVDDMPRTKRKTVNRKKVYAKNARSSALSRKMRTRKRGYSKTSKSKKRYLRKRTYAKRKRYVKRFVRKLNKYTQMTQPYIIFTSERAESWAVTGFSGFGNSDVKGVDVGMARWMPGTGSDIGIFNTTRDDLSQAAYEGYAIGSTATAEGFDNDLFFDDVSAKVCLRNNSNIGVQVDVFYVKRKKSNSASASTNAAKMEAGIKYFMGQSLQTPNPTIHNQLGSSLTLFDFPSVCSHFTLKKKTSMILYPAMTKYFTVKSPISGKSVRVSNALQKTADPRYHRALIFVTRGLPVHSSDDLDFAVGDTAYGANKIDVLISRRLKFRIPVQPLDEDRYAEGFTNITPVNLNKQEIQPAVNPANALVQS